MEGAVAPAAGPDLALGRRAFRRRRVRDRSPRRRARAQEAVHGVKRHHHKHNLKHRYELQETLGQRHLRQSQAGHREVFGPSGELGETRRARFRRGWGRALTRRGLGRRGGLCPRGASPEPLDRFLTHHRPPPPAPAPVAQACLSPETLVTSCLRIFWGFWIPAAK